MAGGVDAASIVQMNTVRASLGLPPLAVPGQDPGLQFKDGADTSDDSDSDDLSTLDKRQAAAGANWEKLETERQERLDRQKRKDAAKKARDAAARSEKLQGKGLGDDEEEEELDTRAWLTQQKKRQKKIDKTRKQAEDLAARQKQAEYTSKDLAGVKVGHEAAQFDADTGEQILTLKDTNIGDESEDDELENADLRAREELEEKLRLKKKRPDYDPTELGEKKTILSKYDEDIDGKAQKRFTLDGKGGSNEAQRRKIQAETSTREKGVKIDLDILKEDVPVSDYLDPAKIKIKKPKKGKKEKKTRHKAVDDDDVALDTPTIQDAGLADAMDVDGAAGGGSSGQGRKRDLDLDDDDLQSRLAEQRRQALKKRKKTDAAELARQMREEMPVDGDEAEEDGIVLDETSEFVANLTVKKLEEASRRQQNKDGYHQTVYASDEKPIKTERYDSDEDEDGDTKMESYADDDKPVEQTNGAGDMTATGLEEEETMSGGMAQTIAMLRKRGVVSEYRADDDRTEAERRRAHFLADIKQLLDEFDAKAKEQREADRRSGRYDKMSGRERDALAQKQNEAREQYISKIKADKYNKEYRPEVKLRYNDEFGREMNQKEAFKHLSHMFHGKGSGKQKTEKRLKKIEDEKKDAAKGMLNIDNEGGMMDVQGREGRRQKKAGVRLQ